MNNAIKLDLTNTPEKFCQTAEEILLPLTELLEELCRLEDQYFVQGKRLHEKGRVIRFQNGIREEITNHQELKETFKTLYRQLLDPHCTSELRMARRDCLHGEHYPSDFNCLRTGCTILFTRKSANKAIVELLPDHDSPVPYDMTDPDVRYMAEDFTVNPPYFYTYLERFRFTMKLTEERWKIDMVQIGGLHDTRWKRDYYF